MVGLTGVIAIQKEGIDVENLLSRMCEAIRHGEGHRTEIHVSGRIGLARVHLGIFNPEAQPVFNEDRTACIMMDGEIYGSQSIRDELISKGHRFQVGNDPELILHLYEEHGNGFVHRLNGCFSLVIWDGNLGKLLMMNDRYGLRPVYYTFDNGYLLFGSEVKAILQDENFRRTVDDRSVAEFFSFGYILGNKTLFRGIELLPPASILTCDGSRVLVEQYWDFDFNKKYGDHPEEYYIERSGELIRQAVKRQMSGNHRIGALLSGGLDSRTVVASIPQEYGAIHTFTYGKQGCNDDVYAREVADKLGTIHHFFEFKPEDLASYAEDAVNVTDGMLNIIHAHKVHSYSEIAKKVDVLLHGWVGDAATGAFLEGFLIGMINTEDSPRIFKRVSDYSPAGLLRNLFSDSYLPLVEKNLKLSMDYISKTGENAKLPANRVMYYNFKERNRRFISVGFTFIRNELEVRTPFSDYDFIDFILNIPPWFKYDQKFYKKMILKMFPALRNIPYQATGFPLYRSNFQIRLVLLYEQVVKSALKKVFGSKFFPSNGKGFSDYGEWMRTDKKLREYVLGILLDRRTLERPYFNPGSIKKILDLHMSRKRDLSILIGKLLTFELWNRQFIDKSKASQDSFNTLYNNLEPEFPGKTVVSQPVYRRYDQSLDQFSPDIHS